MIQAIALLLVFQLAGEVLARAIGLVIPGPAIGMAALFLVFFVVPRLHAFAQPTAQGLLGHLSLLFVPAGVGVVGHLGRLGEDGVALIAAIVVSTVLAIAVGGLVFAGVARLVGGRGE